MRHKFLRVSDGAREQKEWTDLLPIVKDRYRAEALAALQAAASIREKQS